MQRSRSLSLPRLRSLSGLLAMGLAGCMTVGEDYHGAPAQPAGSALFVRNGNVANTAALQAAPWWVALDDATLTRLIEMALAQSPDLQAAKARLAQAAAGLESQRAAGRPKVTSTALVGGLDQAPDTDKQKIYRIDTGSVVASWELDLFGGERRAVEAASASRDAVAADLADAQLALAARVADQYIVLRNLQGQQRLLAAQQQAARETLALIQQRQAQGVATGAEVDQRTSQLAALAMQASQLESDRLVTLDQIALLCGQVPAALDSMLATSAPRLPVLPASLQIGDPASQLQHRPDVRAAERRLAASTAQIGVQQANYFPKVSLLGGVSVMATEPSALFKQSSLALLGGPMLTWDFLDFNRTTTAVSKAGSARDEALANYRGRVLQALNDANSALSRYRQQSEIVNQQAIAQASSEHQLALVSQRRTAGVASGMELLEARQALLSARSQMQGAQASLLEDYILLQKSLGMGWQTQAKRGSD